MREREEQSIRMDGRKEVRRKVGTKKELEKKGEALFSSCSYQACTRAVYGSIMIRLLYTPFTCHSLWAFFLISLLPSFELFFFCLHLVACVRAGYFRFNHILISRSC